MWDALDRRTRDMLLQCVSLNSGYTSQVLPPSKAGEQPQQVGNKTECALLGFVTDLKQNYQSIRDQVPEEKLFKVGSLSANLATNKSSNCA